VLWKKTGDVKPLRRAPGPPKKLKELIERALVQLFVDNVDITIDEALPLGFTQLRGLV
jgi:hypothetical protein